MDTQGTLFPPAAPPGHGCSTRARRPACVSAHVHTQGGGRGEDPEGTWTPQAGPQTPARQPGLPLLSHRNSPHGPLALTRRLERRQEGRGVPCPVLPRLSGLPENTCLLRSQIRAPTVTPASPPRGQMGTVSHRAPRAQGSEAERVPPQGHGSTRTSPARSPDERPRP